MNFEFLANELILDIFEYFNSIQLLRAFHGLNIRMNELLYLHFQRHSLDFRSVPKHDFDDLCQNILPSLTQQITSMHLSSDDDTPNQPNLFFSFGFHFQQFTSLRSLSLYYIRSVDLINKIILNCPHLISLYASKCNFNDETEKAGICANTIWNLPTLQYCYLDIGFWMESGSRLPTRISTSLHFLSIEYDLITLDCLLSLLTSTPNLRSLNISIRDMSEKEEAFSFNIPSLTKLKIYFEGSLHTLSTLLRNLSSLSELIIETDRIWIDGHQWEEFINNYLKKLKVFRLLMFNEIAEKESIDDKINQLMESFQTTFWLDEHQCFVRCDYHTEYGTTYLYTIPYGFKKINRLSTDMSKCTCSTDKRSTSFDYVNTLVLDYHLIRFASQFPLQFSHIHHLDLSYPFDDGIWSMLTKLDRLKTLEIVSIAYPDGNHRPINHLRLLLDRAVRLYSLTMDYLVMSELASLQISNKSIHRLDLISSDGHFYGSECISLIQSLLGDQCEVLLINIENRTVVLDLIDKLPNLRALTFLCQADQWGDTNESLSTEDELVPWLKHRLPPNCSVARDENEVSVIQLWIR